MTNKTVTIADALKLIREALSNVSVSGRDNVTGMARAFSLLEQSINVLDAQSTTESQSDSEEQVQ